MSVRNGEQHARTGAARVPAAKGVGRTERTRNKLFTNPYQILAKLFNKPSLNFAHCVHDGAVGEEYNVDDDDNDSDADDSKELVVILEMTVMMMTMILMMIIIIMTMMMPVVVVVMKMVVVVMVMVWC